MEKEQQILQVAPVAFLLEQERVPGKMVLSA
jgi:hypothetical protein